jgi:NADPH:quinone reductase-like Zn-dependent oxidoreductase
MGRRAELAAAVVPFFEGRLTPAVDDVLPLSDAPKAHERLEAGRQFGKIVLAP